MNPFLSNRTGIILGRHTYMMGACAAGISDIILSIIENQLQEGLRAIGKQNFLKDLKEEVDGKVEKFLNENDGTILTSQVFAEYLKHYKPIEKIFSAFCIPESELCGIRELAEKLPSECAASIEEKGKSIPVTEKDLIKKFFEIVIETVYKKIRKGSTLGERATQAQLKDVGNSVGQVSDKIADIYNILQAQQSLSDVQEEKIFDILYEFLCKGKFREIQELLPLLEGKSDSVKVALAELIDLVSKDNVHADNVAEHVMRIQNKDIREKTIRFIIAYGFLWLESVVKISEQTDNLELKEISDDLYNKRWEKILLESTDEKGQNKKLSLLVAKRYPNEKWLCGRALFWYLNEVQDRSPVNVSEKELEEPITIYDLLLLGQEKVRLHMLQQKIDDLEHEKSLLLSHQENVGFLGPQLKELYWKVLFQICRATLDKDTILNYWSVVPSQMQRNADIQKSLFLAQILDGTVNERELLGFCISHADPSALVFYCSKKDDEFVITFYEQNGRFFADNYFLFEEYILARKRTQQIEGLRTLIEERVTNFEKWIDYWNLYYNLGGEIDLKKLWNQLEAGEIRGTLYAVIEFGHHLLNRGYLSEAEQLYDKFVKNADDDSGKMLHARIMLECRKQIEALEQFKEIATGYQSSEFVIENILYLSFLNKRPIDAQIIEFAKKIDTSKLWCLLAEYYAEKNQKDQTMQAVTKALLRAKETEVDPYLTYLKMYLRFCSEGSAQDKKRIEKDSCIVLREDETDEDCVICIYSDAFAPKQLHAAEPYRWANAFHMTVEEAAENGLYFQEIGDKVNFKGKNYTVARVNPVESFLFSQALSKSDAQNGIYKISLPELENGKLDLDVFYREVKKHIPKRDALLEQYRQLSQIPAPLFVVDQAKNNITYGDFVCRLLQAPDVIVRAFACFPMKETNNTQYVLSFSTEMFFVLAEIGADDFVNQTVYIPQSAIQTLEDEYTKILQDKSRSVVASLGFEGENPVLCEEDGSVKRYFIQKALKRKNECKKLKPIQNKRSFNAPGASEIRLQEVLGICDYDAISIAHHQEVTLVAFEPMIVAMSKKEILGFQCIGIVDFLCNIDLPLHRILKTICLMAKYKFQYILSGQNLECITDKFDAIQDDEYREKCMTLWFDFLDTLDLKDDATNYGKLFRQGLWAAIQECLKGRNTPNERKALLQKPLIRVAAWLLFKPNNSIANTYEGDSEQINTQSEDE